jgi:hypothetical protein
VDPLTGSDTAQFWFERQVIGKGGCIVSGHYLKAACVDSLDIEECLAYLANELPKGHPLWTLASVGIGNIKLYAAANLWQGRACRVIWDEEGGEYVEECVSTPTNSLQQTKQFLWFKRETDLRNPFEESCRTGKCEYDPERAIESYQELSKQLLDKGQNIEYVTAILEQGVLRAASIPGLKPSAFNSVTWYKRGVQTNEEIKQYWTEGPGGSAILVLDNVSDILSIWHLRTVWHIGVENEPQYVYWHKELGW